MNQLKCDLGETIPIWRKSYTFSYFKDDDTFKGEGYWLQCRWCAKRETAQLLLYINDFGHSFEEVLLDDKCVTMWWKWQWISFFIRWHCSNNNDDDNEIAHSYFGNECFWFGYWNEFRRGKRFEPIIEWMEKMNQFSCESFHDKLRSENERRLLKQWTSCQSARQNLISITFIGNFLLNECNLVE